MKVKQATTSLRYFSLLPDLLLADHAVARHVDHNAWPGLAVRHRNALFLISAWGIGANDVANSYATSVSAKSLTLVQAGCLAVITEFIGAIALVQQVTSTIRSGVFKIEPFENSPGVLILANVIAEIGMSREHDVILQWITS